jgi:hypothetical protein
MMSLVVENCLHDAHGAKPFLLAYLVTQLALLLP